MSVYDDIFAERDAAFADLGYSQLDAAQNTANYLGIPTYEGQQDYMGMYGDEPMIPYENVPEEIIPEKRMNIIQANPYVAKAPAPLSADVPDFFTNPFKEDGLLDKGLGFLPGPMGWAWSLMRGANKLNNWWSK